MNKKLSLLILLISLSYCGVAKASIYNIDTPQIKGLPLKFDLPNDHWHLAVSDSSKYIFKRDPITNTDGKRIIPAIMFFAEDAADFKQDVVMFYAARSGNLMKRGVEVDTLMNWQDKRWPFNFKNALLIKAHYVDQNVAHILYMIYIIDNHDKGIQVYLDMTKDIAPQYEAEFMKTIRSLQLLP